MAAASLLLPLLSGAALVRAASCPSGGQTIDLSSASGVNSVFDTQIGASGVSYDGGLKMSITQEMDNIVLQSHDTYSLPLKMEIGIKASPAPGIITTMAAWPGGDGADAIDLETAGSMTNLILLSLFRGGSDSGYNSEITVDAPNQLPNWDWMQIPPGFDTSDAMYEMIWTEKAVQWSVNGQRVATYSTKDASTAWVDSSLPIRLGLWALTDGDWAGQLDWSKNPSADATFTSLKLSCPSEAEMQMTAGSSSSDSSSDNEKREDTDAATSNSSADDEDAKSATPAQVISSEQENNQAEENSAMNREDSSASDAATSTGAVNNKAAHASSNASGMGHHTQQSSSSSEDPSSDAPAEDEESVQDDSSASAISASALLATGLFTTTRFFI